MIACCSMEEGHAAMCRGECFTLPKEIGLQCVTRGPAGRDVIYMIVERMLRPLPTFVILY